MTEIQGSGGNIQHTVERGENLTELADRFNTTLDSIREANPEITNPDLIHPGQVVQVPTSSEGGTVTVQPGQTLSGIAEANNASVDAILRENPQITNPDLIYPGQQINIPAGAQPPGGTPAPVEPPTAEPPTTGPPAAEPPAADPATDPPVAPPAGAPPADDGQLIYADQVSPEFATKVQDIAGRLDMDPNHLMAVMHFETGGTFSPSIRNRASGATGLIQFLPSTARGLGTTTDQLAQMTPERQLDFVEQYLQPYSGRMDTVEDAYMAVFYPAAIGRSNGSTLFSQGTTAYAQNAGLDTNRDGSITKGEAASFPRQRLNEGLAGIGVGGATPGGATPGDGNTVTVRSGDSLSAIANRLGVSLDALRGANPELTNPNLIFPGQILQVPGANTPASDTAATPSNVEVGLEGSDAPLWRKSTADLSNARPEITSTFDDIVAAWSANGGPTPVITSGNDGRHSNGSLHYSDLAVDLRANNLSDALSQQIADDLQARLGPDYDVIFEHFPGFEANDHIHVEYDPN